MGAAARPILAVRDATWTQLPGGDAEGAAEVSGGQSRHGGEVADGDRRAEVGVDPGHDAVGFTGGRMFQRQSVQPCEKTTGWTLPQSL